MTATIDRVPVDPIREAFLHSGRSLSDVALDLGWIRSKYGRHGKPETARVARKLGLQPWTIHGRTTLQRTLSYEEAVRIVRAIGAYPVDCGV